MTPSSAVFPLLSTSNYLMSSSWTPRTKCPLPSSTSSSSSKYITKLAKLYAIYPFEYEATCSLVKVSVKPVSVSQKTRQNAYIMSALKSGPQQPCDLRTFKNFKNQHWPFSYKCGAKKLSSQEIMKFWIGTVYAQHVDSTTSPVEIVVLHFQMDLPRCVKRVVSPMGFPWTMMLANTRTRHPPSLSPTWGLTSPSPCLRL